MLNGITLGVMIIIILLIGGLVLTVLINILLIPLLKTPKSVLQEIVDTMDLKNGDRLVDLGSGDGSLLLKAHRQSMCECTGYDISPIMLILAKTRKVLQFPLDKKINFEAEDIFKVDLNKFTKIYCYLDQKSMEILKPKFEEFVKKNGEIYSYRYGIKGMDNEKIITLKNEDHLYMYKR